MWQGWKKGKQWFYWGDFENELIWKLNSRISEFQNSYKYKSYKSKNQKFKNQKKPNQKNQKARTKFIWNFGIKNSGIWNEFFFKGKIKKKFIS